MILIMLIGSLWAGRIEDSMHLQKGSFFRAPKYDFELPQHKKTRSARNDKLRKDPIFPISFLKEGGIYVFPIGRGLDDVYFKYRGQMIVFTQGSYTKGDQDRIKAKGDSENHKKELFHKWTAITSHFKASKN